jgi:hypothetical protein
MPTCAHLLSFLKIPEFVGSTDMGSLVEFSQTLGSSDPRSVLPIKPHCFVSRHPSVVST